MRALANEARQRGVQLEVMTLTFGDQYFPYASIYDAGASILSGDYPTATRRATKEYYEGRRGRSGASNGVDKIRGWEEEFARDEAFLNATLERSVFSLPEDQERAIAQRREETYSAFLANSVRRELQRQEEEREYEEARRVAALEARRDHVSTANFGHVYHREFHYRGATRRRERLEHGLSIADYYSENWRHVPPNVAMANAWMLTIPHTSRRWNLLGPALATPESARIWAAEKKAAHKAEKEFILSE